MAYSQIELHFEKIPSLRFKKNLVTVSYFFEVFRNVWFYEVLFFVSLGINKLDRDERGIRLDAIHIRGTHNMTTKDIFDFFKDCTPREVEWIDDSSCEFYK